MHCGLRGHGARNVAGQDCRIVLFTAGHLFLCLACGKLFFLCFLNLLCIDHRSCPGHSGVGFRVEGATIATAEAHDPKACPGSVAHRVPVAMLCRGRKFNVGGHVEGVPGADAKSTRVRIYANSFIVQIFLYFSMFVCRFKQNLSFVSRFSSIRRSKSRAREGSIIDTRETRFPSTISRESITKEMFDAQKQNWDGKCCCFELIISKW